MRIPAEIPFLGKFLFLIYGLKRSQPDCRIFESTISPKQINELDFLHVDVNPHKLKVD